MLTNTGRFCNFQMTNEICKTDMLYHECRIGSLDCQEKVSIFINNIIAHILENINYLEKITSSCLERLFSSAVKQGGLKTL